MWDCFCVCDVGSCLFGIDSFEMVFFASVNSVIMGWGFLYVTFPVNLSVPDSLQGPLVRVVTLTDLRGIHLFV